MAKKATKKELEAHREKLIRDLVDFASEWIKLKPGLSVSSKALGNFVTVDMMADQIIKTFTKQKENENAQNN